MDDSSSQGDQVASSFLKYHVGRCRERGLVSGGCTTMIGTTTHCIVHGTVENWFSCDRLGLLQKEGKVMSTETNKALVRRWVEEVLNTPGNLAAVDVLFAPDYVDYTNPPDWPPGRQGHKQIVALYHAAFPDFHYTIEHEVAEGDMVVVRGTYRYTH